jgi:DNA-binding XRE family transcriptional regulator
VDEKTKLSARKLAASAIQTGRLTPQPCESCGIGPVVRGRRVVHAHHEDYLQPLDVRWLCAQHHRQRTAELDAPGRILRYRRKHEFGRRLRELRQLAGLTQCQLAAAVGVDSDSISDWERGKAFPLASRLPQVGSALGVDLAALADS